MQPDSPLRPKRDLMTVGQLAQRTDMSIRAIRDLEARGLIYSAGRSAANYRLFDDTALWCVGVIGTLRGLGLTIVEIEGLERTRQNAPDEPVGLRLAELLTKVDQRIADRIDALTDVRERIDAYRQAHAEGLAGGNEGGLVEGDPPSGAGT